MRTIKRLSLFLPMLALTPSLAYSQASGPLYMPNVNYKLPGLVVTGAQIETLKKAMLEKGASDVPINMLDMGGHQVGLSLVIREAGQGSGPVLHDVVSEVYQMLEGSGVYEIGGELVDAQRRNVSRGNGPGVSGKDIKGGTRFNVGRGDVVFVPAGSPHRWISNGDTVVYTVTRVDPSKSTPLQATSTVVPTTSNTGGAQK